MDAPGMTSEAWAAWVQAGGSILALAIAVGIAWWQGRVQQQASNRAAEERAERARSLAILWCDQIFDSALRLEKAASAESLAATAEQEPVFEDVLEWGRRLELDALTPAAANSIVQIRA